MKGNIFPIIILNGRPAAGKSEVIDYLKKTPPGERIERFHVGEFDELDDFPILWERFEDDDLYEKLGMGRVISDKEYYFKDDRFWGFLIEKLNLRYRRTLRDDPRYHDARTALIEFSRGKEHGGFSDAYGRLGDEILGRAAILYIKVSFEESLRKNRRRFNPDKPDSILEHGLPDEKMEKLYKESDWEELTAGDPGVIKVRGFEVPYAVFNNEPEITDKPDRLGRHLEEVLSDLWKRRGPR
jgi:hypothetical protein